MNDYYFDWDKHIYCFEYAIKREHIIREVNENEL